MKKHVVLLTLLAVGCKPKATPAPPDAATVLAEPGPPAPVSVAPADAAVSESAPAEVDDDLGVVAMGKNPQSRIIWLQANGSRVWLSGNGLDAFAEGDGLLEKGPDLLQKLPYKAKIDRVEVIGHYPRLFALRAKAVVGRGESPEPTVFAYVPTGKGAGKWVEGDKPLRLSWYPTAFVPFRDGAVVVTSRYVLSDGSVAFEEGAKPNATTLTFIGPDAKITELAVDPSFMAFGGSGEPDLLTLVGATVTPEKELEGVQLLRLSKEGDVRKIELQTYPPRRTVDASHIHTARGRTIARPPDGRRLDDTSWKPTAATVLVTDPAGAVSAVTIPGEPNCFIQDARLVGENVYAIRYCEQRHGNELVRVDRTGKAVRVRIPDLPALAGITCRPQQLVVREPDDLWLTTRCGDLGATNVAVFRRGHSQPPLEIP